MKASLPIIALLVMLYACQSSAPEARAEESATVISPVTVTHAEFGPISDSLVLNASSSYLQNSYIKAIAAGYVRSVSVKPGEYVSGGQLLFTLETKEASIIGNAVSALDSGFRFSGQIKVTAKGHGFVTQLGHQVGDYVQDGEQLAVISDQNSFVFLLNMPYENRKTVLASRSIMVELPDGTRLPATIGTVLPTVDSATQTQTVVLHVSSVHPLPENLIAKVKILSLTRKRAQTVPANAVLSDDAQTAFWVMKMMDSSTAVKVPITKGLESPDRIEVLQPLFSPDDEILVTGNYGLPDTAKVTIDTVAVSHEKE